MSNWERVEEEGNVFWVDEDHGNVFQQGPEAYVALMPKILKLGPFKTLEQAQTVLENYKQRISEAVDIANAEILKEIGE